MPDWLKLIYFVVTSFFILFGVLGAAAPAKDRAQRIACGFMIILGAIGASMLLGYWVVYGH